jgi:RimJ/RimL family protein N-acetyltransferase
VTTTPSAPPRAAHVSVRFATLDANQAARRFYESCGLRWDGSSKLEQRPGYAMNDLRYRIELGEAPSAA